MSYADQVLKRLSELIQLGSFAELETEVLEVKPVPPNGGQWKELYKSINAFLNTRGGIIILGVKEEGTGIGRKYVLSGWKDNAEPNLKDISRQFTDRKGVKQDLADCFPPFQVRPLNGGRVALIFVDELAADRKFAFFGGAAYKRMLAGDHKISESEIESQEEFREEAVHARELKPMAGLTADDLNLTKLNQFIFQLNQLGQIETMKSDLQQAVPFLERRSFLKDGVVTILGALVCATHPGDSLGFRSQVHGNVDLPERQYADDQESQVVKDKQDFVDNVLQLMELGLGYLLRNIQVGINVKDGGTSSPQYPISLLRETVNNALAHRDYQINSQVVLAIRPGEHIAIHNPGRFRKLLLIEEPNDPIPILRIIPEAKPRNPKLADVLRVYRKWEGRGIGMATLVNLCLQNQMDLPYYRLLLDEVRLFLCSGQLLDEHMERLFQSFAGYIESRLQGNSMTREQMLVLSYLIKSEWANSKLRYTILMTPDNNHFGALRELEGAGLIQKHPKSTANYPIYLADRVLMRREFKAELRAMFGAGFDVLDNFTKQALSVVYRYNEYSKSKLVSAKQATFTLWYEAGGTSSGIEEFDTFYRKVRYFFNKLEKAEFIVKQGERKSSRGYVLNNEYLKKHLI